MALAFMLLLCNQKQELATCTWQNMEVWVLCSLQERWSDSLAADQNSLPALWVAEHWNGRSAAPSCGKIRSMSIHLRLFFLYHRPIYTYLLFTKKIWEQSLKLSWQLQKYHQLKVFSRKFPNELIYKWKGLKCNTSLNP